LIRTSHVRKMQCDFSASSARVSYFGGDNRGAVGFQRNVLEQLGFQELSGAMPVIERISEANPGLELERKSCPEARGASVQPVRLRGDQLCMRRCGD